MDGGGKADPSRVSLRKRLTEKVTDLGAVLHLGRP